MMTLSLHTPEVPQTKAGAVSPPIAPAAAPDSKRRAKRTVDPSERIRTANDIVLTGAWRKYQREHGLSGEGAR